MFKPEEGTNINHVAMESVNGKVDLTFNGTRWMVNDKYEADRQLIKLLFAILEKTEPKRPVSTNQLDSVNYQLLKKGVDVNLFEDTHLVLSFRAGGNTQKTEAYFQRKDDGLPYVMTVPGYRLYISYLFELDENGWRDKRIFNFNWRNFKSLNMLLSDDPSQNFEVSFQDQFFGIKGIASVDTTKLSDYLDAVSLLAAEQFILPGFSTLYDSLLKTNPAFHLEVKDISDKTYSLDLYAPMANDPNVLGRLNGNQPAIFTRSTILPIAKKRAFFPIK
ncbi:MAG: DUF4340 domain-containing protein [Bacteroidota bacterium]